MTTTHRLYSALPLVLVAAAACSRGEAASSSRSESRTDSGARRVITVLGARDPESVKYDPDQDVFFVSMMNGFGSAKDNNGYIVRIPAAAPDQASMFAESGKSGVTLNAPKGMAIHGDTLWVADIDVLRGFDRHSGAPVRTVDFTAQHPALLNDVALGPDGKIYVTDTGIQMTEFGVLYVGGDGIYSVGPGGAVTVVEQGGRLGRPNGITWDARAKRWLVVTFDPFQSSMYTFKPGDTTLTILAHGTGKWDGVEALPDGRILVSSWSDSSVHEFGAGGWHQQVIRAVPEPADIGYDSKRNRVAIPITVMGRVEVWELGPGR